MYKIDLPFSLYRVYLSVMKNATLNLETTMNAKTKILEIETKLANLNSDLSFALATLNSANAVAAAAFEVDDANSIKDAKDIVNARTYDVECLCEAKRALRSKLPALHALYTSELNA